MSCKPKHIEELGCLLSNIRENNFRSRSAGGIDHAEKDRYADTVDDLGLRKVYDQLLATLVQALAAFTLDLLAGQLVEVIPGENDSAFIGRSHGFWF